MEHFYIYLKHNDSSYLYPDNTPLTFTVQLPKTLDLQGEWDVGLWEMLIDCETSGKRELYICCDCAPMTCVSDTSLRVLRRLTLRQKYNEHEFNPVQYFTYDASITRRNTIQISILPVRQNISTSLGIKRSECTLHFRRRSHESYR